MRIHDFTASAFNTAGKSHSDVCWARWKDQFHGKAHGKHMYAILYNFTIENNISLQQSSCEKDLRSGNTKQKNSEKF